MALGARHYWAYISAAVLACGLAACGATDHYSGRAVRYNLQAERAQQQALLLNVVRSSLRRPMQFTTVTTLTANASAKAGGSFVFPFGPNISTSNTASIEPEYSENTEASVSVLDQNDFYNGLLSPVPGKLFDLYIQSGYPPDVLFNMFIKKIIMKRLNPPCFETSHERECEFTFHNSPASDIDIDLFQRVLNYLLRLGLTTEPIAALDGMAKSKGDSKKDKNKEKDKDKDDDDSSKSDTDDYTFCFAPRERGDVKYVRSSLCGPAKSTIFKSITAMHPTQPQVIKRRSVLGRMRITQEVIADLVAIAAHYDHPEIGPDLRTIATGDVLLVFYTRSMENMIFYLGELVRRQLYPDYPAIPRIIQAKAAGHFDRFPEHVCDGQEPPLPKCHNLFVVEEGPPLISNSVFSVDYEGHHFAVREDFEHGGFSNQVLDIAKQLFVVNIKSDKLPRTTTISVIGR